MFMVFQRTFSLLGIAFSIFLVCRCGSPEGNSIISNVHIINVEDGTIGPPVDIFIRAKTIVRISAHDSLSGPNGAINGNGGFVIPGLWDMHAHPDDPEVWRMKPDDLSRDKLMPQFVLRGVLGIRDMGGSLETINRWRTLGESGQLLVPNIVAGGPLLDGPNPMWDGSVGIDSPTKAPQIIDSLIAEGVDFLKIYSLLPRETYFAVANYANSKKIPFAGHVPYTVTTSEAAKTGMKSQEHLLEILRECSDYDEAVAKGAFDPTKYSGTERYVAMNDFMLSSFDTTRFLELIKVHKSTNTWHCPTLSMWYKNAWFESERARDDSLWTYLPPYLKSYWTEQENDHLRNRDDEEFKSTKKRLYAHYLYIVRTLDENDIPLLAGTDTGANPLCWPGIGVVNEMRELERAGVPRLRVLQSATLNPVKYLGLSDSLGTVAVGRRADFLLLENNPLENLDALYHLEGISFKGNFLDKHQIETKLKGTKSF